VVTAQGIALNPVEHIDLSTRLRRRSRRKRQHSTTVTVVTVVITLRVLAVTVTQSCQCGWGFVGVCSVLVFVHDLGCVWHTPGAVLL
jgi:hypothetical protein